MKGLFKEIYINTQIFSLSCAGLEQICQLPGLNARVAKWRKGNRPRQIMKQDANKSSSLWRWDVSSCVHVCPRAVSSSQFVILRRPGRYFRVGRTCESEWNRAVMSDQGRACRCPCWLHVRVKRCQSHLFSGAGEKRGKNPWASWSRAGGDAHSDKVAK